MEIRTDGSTGVRESGSNDVTENGTVDRITGHGTLNFQIGLGDSASTMIWTERGAHLIELTAQAWLASLLEPLEWRFVSTPSRRSVSVSSTN